MNRFKPVIFVAAALALTFTSAYSAEENSGFLCWPSQHDARLVVYRSGDQIHFKISHADGYEMIPQFEGPISPFLLPFAKSQAQELQELSSEFVAIWPANQCKVFSPEKRQVSCDLAGRIETAQAQPVLLRSYKVTEEGSDSSEISYKFRLSLAKEGNTYFMTLVFPERSCKAFGRKN